MYSPYKKPISLCYTPARFVHIHRPGPDGTVRGHRRKLESNQGSSLIIIGRCPGKRLFLPQADRAPDVREPWVE